MPAAHLQLKAQVDAIRWWHRIDLGHGITTPGVDRTEVKMRQVGLPDTLKGLSVLDIGAWDGAFSFEAERRGAARVVAVDQPVWNNPHWGKAGFELARAVLESKVEDIEATIDEIDDTTVPVSDVVLFLGVLYHLRNPFDALERVASVTGRHLILETGTDMLWHRRPAAAFYPGSELAQDASNWWGMNPAAVVAMLKTCGFEHVRVHHSSGILNRLGRAVGKRAKGTGTFFTTLSQGRCVIHAER